MGFNLDDYEPVEDRLRKFWEENPNGRVATDVTISEAIGWVIVKAELYRNPRVEGDPFASGYAHSPIKGGKQAEGTHPLETCETSAIGRALANGNFAAKGAPRPSREEMRQTQTTSDLLHLVEDLNDEERAEFASVIKANWPGLGLKEVPFDLVPAVTEYALQIVSGRYAQPVDAADVSEFGEEPF